MATVPVHVNPGDLITADFINQILDELSSLETRVTALQDISGAASAVAVSGFTFTSPLRVGDRLEVDGHGFAVPAVLNQVTVGGSVVPISAFATNSSDTALVFDVPDVPNLSSTGTQVTVRVSNAKGVGEMDVNLQPKLEVPAGRLDVEYTAPVMPVGTPNVASGSKPIFIFTITAYVNRDATYNVNPTMDSTSSAAGWTVDFLEDASDNVRSTNVVSIPGDLSGKSMDIRLRVNVPSSATNNSTGTLTLAVTETTPGSKVTPGNQLISLSVGSPPPTPDNRVRISLNLADNGATVAGSGIQFTRGQTGRVQFTLLFMVGGTFNVTANILNPSGWAPQGISPSNLTVAAPPPGNQTTNQNVNVFFTAGVGAANTTLIVTVSGTPSPQVGSAVDIQYAIPVTVA